MFSRSSRVPLTALVADPADGRAAAVSVLPGIPLPPGLVTLEPEVLTAAVDEAFAAHVPEHELVGVGAGPGHAEGAAPARRSFSALRRKPVKPAEAVEPSEAGAPLVPVVPTAGPAPLAQAHAEPVLATDAAVAVAPAPPVSAFAAPVAVAPPPATDLSVAPPAQPVVLAPGFAPAPVVEPVEDPLLVTLPHQVPASAALLAPGPAPVGAPVPLPPPPGYGPVEPAAPARTSWLGRLLRRRPAADGAEVPVVDAAFVDAPVAEVPVAEVPGAPVPPPYLAPVAPVAAVASVVAAPVADAAEPPVPPPYLAPVSPFAPVAPVAPVPDAAVTAVPFVPLGTPVEQTPPGADLAPPSAPPLQAGPAVDAAPPAPPAPTHAEIVHEDLARAHLVDDDAPVPGSAVPAFAHLVPNQHLTFPDPAEPVAAEPVVSEPVAAEPVASASPASTESAPSVGLVFSDGSHAEVGDGPDSAALRHVAGVLATDEPVGPHEGTAPIE